MSDWVPSFDDSFDPINDLPAAYKAGYRVWARYVGPGSSGKQWTKSEIAHWFAQGPDTGVAMLAEGVGDEPITHPGLGDDHGREARQAIIDLGIDPDKVLCSPAVDRNVNQSQTMGPVQDYMDAWKRGYQGLPVPYIELENGGRLVHAGSAAATFTPAAYGWNENGHLVTPDNAPAYVCQTQEHNGVKRFGGTIDIGNCRTDAPHVYWNPEGIDMDLTPQNLKDIAAANWNFMLGKSGRTAAMNQQDGYNNGVATKEDVEALQTEVTAMQATLAEILAAIDAGGGNGSVSGDLEVTGTVHVKAPTS